MKIHFYFLTFCILTASILFSCESKRFAAGSYPYAESIKSDCPGDSIIKRLIILKATGLYNNKFSFKDGPDNNQKLWYDFYFYSRKNNFLLHMTILSRSSKKSTILLVNLKDFNIKSDWLEFNRDVSINKQKEVTTWFNETIRPITICH